MNHQQVAACAAVMALRSVLNEPGLPARVKAAAKSPSTAIRHAFAEDVPAKTRWCPAAASTVAMTAKEAARVTPLADAEAEAKGRRRTEENRNE
ncbi:hypothetical protein [Streptomyces sp. NPDC059957]|uniref:hypothetical protein n=1 Tax=Streptomyces sp. NPDC059957 TaxID=3347016 RepID=UPI0036656F40